MTLPDKPTSRNQHYRRTAAGQALVEPDRTEQVTLGVKRSVLAYFRAPGKGYQSRMNRVVESYVRAQGK